MDRPLLTVLLLLAAVSFGVALGVSAVWWQRRQLSDLRAQAAQTAAKARHG